MMMWMMTLANWQSGKKAIGDHSFDEDEDDHGYDHDDQDDDGVRVDVGDDDVDDGLGTLTVRQKDNRRPFSCLSHIVRKLTQTLKVLIIIMIVIIIIFLQVKWHRHSPHHNHQSCCHDHQCYHHLPTWNPGKLTQTLLILLIVIFFLGKGSEKKPVFWIVFYTPGYSSGLFASGFLAVWLGMRIIRKL